MSVASSTIVIARDDIIRSPQTVLGIGGEGSVYAGHWKSRNNQKVAIKKYKEHSNGVSKINEREIAALSRLRHPNIIRFYGVVSEENEIILEWADYGSLYDVIHERTTTVAIVEQRVALDVAIGLRFLHQENIFHMDMKSSNILICANGVAKIADFGLSTIKKSNQSLVSARASTLAYVAPEATESGAIAPGPVDIFAYGIILWEIVSKKLPFKGYTDSQIPVMVNRGRRPEDVAPSLSIVPSAWKEAIAFCWHQQPEERYDAEELVPQIQSLPPLQPAASLTTSGSKSAATLSGGTSAGTPPSQSSPLSSASAPSSTSSTWTVGTGTPPSAISLSPLAVAAASSSSSSASSSSTATPAVSSLKMGSQRHRSPSIVHSLEKTLTDTQRTEAQRAAMRIVRQSIRVDLKDIQAEFSSSTSAASLLTANIVSEDSNNIMNATRPSEAAVSKRTSGSGVQIGISKTNSSSAVSGGSSAARSASPGPQGSPAMQKVLTSTSTGKDQQRLASSPPRSVVSPVAQHTNTSSSSATVSSPNRSPTPKKGNSLRGQAAISSLATAAASVAATRPSSQPAFTSRSIIHKGDKFLASMDSSVNLLLHLKSFIVPIRSVAPSFVTEVFFCIWSKHSAKFVTEEFVVRMSSQGMPLDINKIGSTGLDVWAVFKSLPRSRLLEKDLILVCKIIRVGEMVLAQRKLPKENYRRPVGGGIITLSLSDDTNGSNKNSQRTAEIEQTISVFAAKHERESPALHELILNNKMNSIDPLPNAKGVCLGLRYHEGPSVPSEEPWNSLSVYPQSLFEPEKTLSRSVGLQDFFIRLDSCEVLSEQISVQICLTVRNEKGNLLSDCIYVGAGEKPVAEYRSVVYYKTSKPRFDELIRVTMPREMLNTVHFFFELKHCTKSKTQSNIAISYFETCSSAYADGEQILPLLSAKNPSDLKSLRLYDPEMMRKDSQKLIVHTSRTGIV